MWRRIILWLVAVGAVLVPLLAVTVRVQENRAAARQLAEAVAILDAPVERAVDVAPAELARARALLERAWHADPEGDAGRRARALWHVARAYLDLGRGEVVMARQETDVATHLAPGDPFVALAAATVAARRDDRVRAEQALAALARAPRGRVPASVAARAALLRVDLLLDAGRAHDALAAAEALDRDHPAVAAVKNRVGLARAAVGDRDGAREAYLRAAELDPRSEAPLVNLARLARDEGDLARARATLERALGIAPDGAEAWLAYGVVLSELRDPAARHALVRAAALAPDDAASYVAQGNVDLSEGNLAGAVESFRAALARRPDDATAQTNLGVALARQGQHAAAAEAFERATRLAPHQGEAWNGLGAVRLSLGDPHGAAGPLRQASVLLPADPNPLLNLGRALLAIQRWEDAARAFREALRRAPDNEVARRHLAQLTSQQVSLARATRHDGRLAQR